MESRTSAGSVCEIGFFGDKTACFDGNAAVRNHRRRQLGVDGYDADGGAVPEGGGEDGYRTVLDRIACSTQPCIGVYVAGDSLAPTAGGRTGRRGSLVVFAAWAIAKLGHNLSVVLLIGMDQSIC